MFSFFNNLSLIHRKTLAFWVIIAGKKIKARGLEDHLMFKRPFKKFWIFGLRKEKANFNQQNKPCFALFCTWFYAIKEMVHDLACSIELWESTQKSGVALGYHLEQLLRFFRTFPTSRVHQNSMEHAKSWTISLLYEFVFHTFTLLV